MYQFDTEEKLIFFQERLLQLLEFSCFEPGFYTSFTDFVETMNTLIQKRHNYSEK